MNSETVTQRFINSFDSQNKEHVQWLKKFFEFSASLAAARLSIDDFINTNPMGVKVSKEELIQWVHIHFSLSMKYSKDVLNKKAWIP